MDWTKWLAALAVLALLPLAGCVEDEGADESTANDEDVRIEGDDDLRVDCTGDTEDHGEEESGYVQCDLDDGNTE